MGSALVYGFTAAGPWNLAIAVTMPMPDAALGKILHELLALGAPQVAWPRSGIQELLTIIWWSVDRLENPCFEYLAFKTPL